MAPTPADIRICPYCQGEVLTTARKCRHCGEWLPETAPVAPAASDAAAPPTSSPGVSGPQVVEVTRRPPERDTPASAALPGAAVPGNPPAANLPPGHYAQQHVHVTPGAAAGAGAPAAQTVNVHVAQPHPGWPAYNTRGPMAYTPAKPPATFAIITLIFYFFMYPVGLVMNLVGLIVGPRRGCFFALLLVWAIIPGALALLAGIILFIIFLLQGGTW